MKLINTKAGYFPHCYPFEIKDNVLKYFIVGKGWKKTKAFKIVEGVELPERWSEITWLQIAKYYDQYGIEVAATYAETKTAGIVAKQTAEQYGIMYQKIKDLIPENFDSDFFECLSADYMLGCFGFFLFDIVATDKKLSKIDPDYYSEQAMYKDRQFSMKEYITLKYGAVYTQIIERLNETPAN